MSSAPSPSTYVARSIEELLRSARLDAGWSQRQLADAVGVTRQYISGCERGDTPLRLDGVQRLLEPLGLVVSVSAEPRQEEQRVLPREDRVPAWTLPILAAAPRTTVTGTLGLRLCGVPIELTEVELLVGEVGAASALEGLAAAGFGPGPGGVSVTVLPRVRLAYPHDLLPEHTVVPIALNPAWPLDQRQAWIERHGQWP